MKRLSRAPLAAALLLAALLVAGGHAAAQVSLDEPLDEHAAKRLDRMEKAMRELRAIVFQGRETGKPVVVQPAETQPLIAAQGDKINDLNQTLSKVNGQLEVITHDLDQAHHDIADLRTALSAMQERVSLLEKAAKDAAAAPAQSAQAQPTAAADPAAVFAAAKTVYDSGDMAGAETALRDYVDHYGDGPGGPEARYWLAKTLMARDAWPDAATAEIGAIRGWPKTRWAPDAVLDLSKSLVALGKTTDACQTLDELAKRYPKASPATLKSAAAVRARARCK